MLNDDVIVASVHEESDPADDEMDEDEDNNESSKGPSNADAFSALETAMEWYEHQSACRPAQLLLLKRLRDQTAKKNAGVQWIKSVAGIVELRVCVLMSLKTTNKEGLMHVKSVVAQIPHIDVVWKLRKLGVSSGVVLKITNSMGENLSFVLSSVS
ncbi:hypothetical protein TNCV_3598871 [Trichonephila clavipes]|nr:hypothetical protein TNCV_3598871 [Trichonephila clavipes]